MSLLKMDLGRPALTLAALAAAACSSSPGSGGETTTPNALTLPCDIHTGYAGDANCIAPPDPKIGFQFHYGPSNYKDKNEVAKYLIKPGQEMTDCVFMPSVNTETVYIQEYHSRLRPGSHHLLNYVQPTTNGAAPTTSDGPTACNQNANFRMLFGATSQIMDVERPASGAENNGVAVQLGPKQQVALQLHVVNATSGTILREAWANFKYADKSAVTELADPIQFMAGVISSINVGQTVINSGTATVPANASPDFRLIAAIPHIHAHTTKFTAYKTIGGKRELLLEQFGTLDIATEPHIVYFDSETTNPPANEATHQDGAYTGIVHLAPGDTIDWECEQTNDGIGANGQKFTTPLQFTEQAYTGEMCNLFGLYAPTTGGSWSAIGLKSTVVATN
jgi:hypothetical protein